MQVIPGILEKEWSEIERKIEAVKNFAKTIHIDIIDGKFVPNKTIDYLSFNGLKRLPKIEFHLMVKEPKDKIIRYIPYCDLIVFHYESTKDVFSVIKEVKKHDKKVGIALNPQTKASVIFPYLSYLDEILIMSVTPGRSGQKFKSGVLSKIKEIRKINKKIDICVDGGISDKTLPISVKAGANCVSVNSYLYNSENLAKTYAKLKRISKNAR